MSIWFRVYCTRSLRQLPFDSLRHALDPADFAMMAEWMELDAQVGYDAEASLQFEETRRTGDRWVVLVHYQHHVQGKRFVRMELWSKPSEVQAEVDEVKELLKDDRRRPVVLEALAKVQETVAFELKVSDTEGMGSPIAFHLAMWLGQPERGAGLVDCDGDWWNPMTHKRLEP